MHIPIIRRASVFWGAMEVWQVRNFEQLVGRCLQHWDDGVVIEET